jgi:ATP-dependent DNA helicase PIF1
MVHLKTPEYDVICENCNTNFSDSQKWAFKSSVWPKLKLRHVQLQQIHRQKDHQFQDILYKIRHGIMLNVEQWKILESRKELPRGICAVRLMSRRKDVDALNARELSQIQSPAKSWEALDFYNPRFEGPVKDLKPWESEKPLDNHRFPKTVTLKVGAKVVLLSNIDQKNGLVNGSQGEVVGFQKHRGMECDPSITYLEADSAQTKRGSKKKTWNAETRAAPVVRFANGITRPIFAVDVSSRTGKQKNYQYLATRVQIPLALAWALTIHKSQGMTLSYLEVLSRDIFERGQFYVALSRGTSLAGLTVTGYTREQLPVDKDVTEFYQNTTWESFAPVRDPPASQPNEAEKQTEETTEIPDTNAKSYAGLDQNVLEQE